MKELIATAALLLMAPALASAQEADYQPRGQGYFYFGPAARVSPTTFFPGAGGVAMTTGLGAEGFIYRGLGVGAEVGYAGPHWSFDSSGMGVGSVDASYHFFPRKKNGRVEPFVAGGYSLYFGHGKANGFNVGGGVNVWLGHRAALRLEVRDFGNAGIILPAVDNFIAFRFGMTFR